MFCHVSLLSLTLVLHFKTSKIFYDMAKVSIKSEKITAFGGKLFVLDKYDSILSSATQCDTMCSTHCAWHVVRYNFIPIFAA
jgi:hypothetical protein